MDNKSKLKFRVGDLVKFAEEDNGADEFDDYGIVLEIKKLKGGYGMRNHYGILWIVDKGHTFEEYEWADKTLKLFARGKNEKRV